MKLLFQITIVFFGSLSIVSADHEPPDGTITFTRFDSRDPATTTGDIYAMDLDGSNLRRLTTASKTHADSIEPDFSPNGERIVFSSHRNNNADRFTDLYIMNAWDMEPMDGSTIGDGQGDACMRLTTDSDNGFESSSPTFSPYGTQIAFRSTSEGFDPEADPAAPKNEANGDIVVIDSDGGSRVNLTSDFNFDDASPTWSPDGTKIAFVRDNDIYTVQVTSPFTITSITSTPAIYEREPDWGSDNFLVYSRIDLAAATKRLYKIDMSNPITPVPLTPPSLSDGDASFSPSADHIIFTRTVDTDPTGALRELSHLYIMHADGSSPVSSTNGGTPDAAGSWTPLSPPVFPLPNINCEYTP